MSFGQLFLGYLRAYDMIASVATREVADHSVGSEASIASEAMGGSS